MAIKVLAGDWEPGTGCSFVYATYGRPDRLRIGFFGPEFAADAVESLETVTEQNKTSILGKTGWGVVGLVALGPLGMLAGLLGGGNRHEKIVALELTNGQRALLRCDAKSYGLMMRLAFKPGNPAQKAEARVDLSQPPRQAPSLERADTVNAAEPEAMEPLPAFMSGLKITYGEAK